MFLSCFVTPLAGVWIEIGKLEYKSIALMSLPLRECGLKSSPPCIHTLLTRVTPLAGVWIEMVTANSESNGYNVTPLAGVWIEISNQ